LPPVSRAGHVTVNMESVPRVKVNVAVPPLAIVPTVVVTKGPLPSQGTSLRSMVADGRPGGGVVPVNVTALNAVEPEAMSTVTVRDVPRVVPNNGTTVTVPFRSKAWAKAALHVAQGAPPPVRITVAAIVPSGDV